MESNLLSLKNLFMSEEVFRMVQNEDAIRIIHIWADKRESPTKLVPTSIANM
jgi:hypothetical protein